MTLNTAAKPRRTYDDAEVRRREREQRVLPRLELERACRAVIPNPADAVREVQRRVAIMERVAYWSRKPHAYVSNLDPLGSMCDLCWASVDASQHLLHPIAHVKSF